MLPALHRSDVPSVDWVVEIVHHINPLIPGTSLRPDPAHVGKLQFSSVIAVISPLWPKYIVEIAHDSRQPAFNWATKYQSAFLVEL